jgi:hypothetical protein
MRGGPIKGNSTITVEVRGATDIQKALRKWLEPELTNQLDAANKKAAQTLARELRAELRPVSRHMSRAVRVKRARTGKPGWVVGSRRKIAFFWHMVIGGTRDHGPRKAAALVFVPNWNPYIGASSHGIATGHVVRTRRVRGVRPNPIVERVAARNESQVVQQIDRDMDKNV